MAPFWETHLYTYAVSYYCRANITPDNLSGIRQKALRHGHTEGECQIVERDPLTYIRTGRLIAQPVMDDAAIITKAHARLDQLCDDFSFGKPDADDIHRHAETVAGEIKAETGVTLEITMDAEGSLDFHT